MGDEREFNLDEISIYGILKDLFRNIWVIILAALAGWFGVTGVCDLTYVPQYTAAATMAVSAKGENGNAYSSLTVASQMAEVFNEVFQSDILREKIAETMGVDAVDGEITSTVIQETNLLNLSVVSADPRQAYMILDAALDNYESVSGYLFSNAVLRIVEEPTVPYSPSNVQNTDRYRKLGAAAGAALVICAIGMMSVLRYTVKTRTGAKRNLEGRIRGTIPYEYKAHTLKGMLKKEKHSLLISSALVSTPFSEAVRKTSTRVEQHLKRRGQQVLLISSVAENEGKSSVAANLALALAEKGRKVVLLDMDLRKPALYKVFDRPKIREKMLSDYLQGNVGLEDILNYDRQTRLYRIFQDKAVSGAARLIESERFAQLIEECREKADYVIVDSSPMGVTSDVEILMKYVDSVLLVVRQDWSDIRAINDKVDVIGQCRKDFAGFVLNAFHQEMNLEDGTAAYYGYRGYRENHRGRWENERKRTGK
ncbi:MAG TPA: polysaccharide biosynthesis tyrosine autokinase [Candidatus Mediterraneibacter stercoripullorum]|nr:polysaccharide biosynthesis tyrosine autokinase [Candidatus Mediterraneibacter stercoripullorum]